VAGVPVGREIPDLRPTDGPQGEDAGSIIVVLATDAPLLPHQLKRVAQRIPLGIGLVGGRGGNSSGDIFVAFSTANRDVSRLEGLASLTMLPNERINPLFDAAVQATEEAIVNALVAAETMTGVNGRTVYALPHDRLQGALRKYGRLPQLRN
jgi:L-aminopeptidase/D-esterase-like protein